MCGIAGIVERKDRRPDVAALQRMVDLVRYRGPDDCALHVAGPCALGHARLSVIDLDTGRQPMCNEDGTVWIVFNGEIYNYVELREGLEAKGHRFRTRSDTEVIVHLFEEEGETCVTRLNGQWAFAVWDSRRRQLMLARDHAGIAPLYYAWHEERFLFGSEMKCLLSYPGFPRGLDPRALDNLITTWSVLAPRTLFRGVVELPPGHTLMLNDGHAEVRSYWQPSYDDVDSTTSEDDLCAQVRSSLVEATRLRFQRADVPVGAYLSGGLDSTLIASIARRFTDVELHTFSVRFEDEEFDEGPHQEAARRFLGVEHRELLCRKEDIARHFPEVIWHTEQLIVRTAPAPMFLLSRFVRDAGYKVVLTGEGADEMFGGYDIFKEAKVRRWIAENPDSQLRPLLLRRLYPYLPALQLQSPAYLKAFFQARPEDLDSPLFSHLPRWNMSSRNRVFLSEAMAGSLSGYDTASEMCAGLPDRFGQWHPLGRAQFLESSHFLPGYLLSSQGDRMIMGNGVEGRYPYLDQNVMAMACRLPARLKMKALDEKYILKRAATDLIPDGLRRRTKQPYRAPEAASFFDPATGKARAPYIEDLLSESALTAAGIFNPKPVRLLVQKARDGKAGSIRDGMALTTILSGQLVASQFVHRLGIYAA